MAPTAMKTVPSGRVECRINGARWVGGTAGGGYVGMLRSAVLDRDGRPVSLPVGPAAGPEMVGGGPAGVVGRVLVLPPVIRLVCWPFDVVGWPPLFDVVGVLPFPLVVVCCGGPPSVVSGGGGGGSS